MTTLGSAKADLTTSWPPHEMLSVSCVNEQQKMNWYDRDTTEDTQLLLMSRNHPQQCVCQHDSICREAPDC